MELITADANLVFTAALVLMVLIALFEGLALLLGMGFSHILDTLLPNIHVDVDYVDIFTFAVISSQQNYGEHLRHTDYGFRIASTQAEARISTTAAAASSTISISTSRCVHARMD